RIPLTGGLLMRCFPPPADVRFYAGVDLHARPLFLIVLDHDGKTRLRRNLSAVPQPFLHAVQSFRGGRRSPQACWVRLVLGLWGQESRPPKREQAGSRIEDLRRRCQDPGANGVKETPNTPWPV